MPEEAQGADKLAVYKALMDAGLVSKEAVAKRLEAATAPLREPLDTRDQYSGFREFTSKPMTEQLSSIGETFTHNPLHGLLQAATYPLSALVTPGLVDWARDKDDPNYYARNQQREDQRRRALSDAEFRAAGMEEGALSPYLKSVLLQMAQDAKQRGVTAENIRQERFKAGESEKGRASRMELEGVRQGAMDRRAAQANAARIKAAGIRSQGAGLRPRSTEGYYLDVLANPDAHTPEEWAAATAWANQPVVKRDASGNTVTGRRYDVTVGEGGRPMLGLDRGALGLPQGEVTSEAPRYANLGQVRQSLAAAKAIFDRSENKRLLLTTAANNVPLSDGRTFRQAIMDTVNAKLYDTSGAQINEAEFARISETVMPSPLDKDEAWDLKFNRIQAWLDRRYPPGADKESMIRDLTTMPVVTSPKAQAGSVESQPTEQQGVRKWTLEGGVLK